MLRQRAICKGDIIYYVCLRSNSRRYKNNNNLFDEWDRPARRDTTTTLYPLDNLLSHAADHIRKGFRRASASKRLKEHGDRSHNEEAEAERNWASVKLRIKQPGEIKARDERFQSCVQSREVQNRTRRLQKSRYGSQNHGLARPERLHHAGFYAIRRLRILASENHRSSLDLRAVGGENVFLVGS